MTDNEKRVRIAQACGLLKRQEGEIIEYQRWDGQCNGVFQRVRFLDGSSRPCYIENIPNYLTDLNACHEMEKVLDKEPWMKFAYINSLVALVQQPQRHENEALLWWQIAHATARQRAEAFLMTIGGNK